MTSTGVTALQGADEATVSAALEAGEPLPGTRGFAGVLDGQLVRDVLGRYPLYQEGGEPTRWSHDPGPLDSPEPVPAGHVVSPEGRRRIWSLPRPDPVSPAQGLPRVREAVEAAVDSVRADDLAIAFSGGLDSGILAARLDAPLYVVGFPGSHDIQAARDAAERLAAPLTVVELDHAALETAVPRVARAIGRQNAMDVGIALPLFCLAEAAAADGVERLAVGQGADELFGGYAKVATAPDDPRVEADTVRGARRELLEELPAELARDVLAIRAGGLEPVCPLLQDEVVEAALSLPAEAIVGQAGERKQALRRAARTWLPDPIAFREKKALQYGSLVARELDRLARQAGFKRRRADHVSRYVAASLQ
jgi:asparagine synthase (glutamine-hydrolysing)